MSLISSLSKIREMLFKGHSGRSWQLPSRSPVGRWSSWRPWQLEPQYVIMMTTATSMKEMTLKPRQSPKSPPSDEKKSTQVIRALRSISEEDNLCSSQKGLIKLKEIWPHLHSFKGFDVDNFLIWEDGGYLQTVHKICKWSANLF